MRCPFCSYPKTIVVDKRYVEEYNANRRRRECPRCKRRFTTYERFEPLHLTVIKKDGRREAFDRDKILRGILKACEKRPIKREVIDRVVNKIENELYKGSKKEVKSKYIGELVMKHLKRLDKVAYIRFASVYREFSDVDSFEEEIRKIKRGRSNGKSHN